jgi:hypothetical protein
MSDAGCEVMALGSFRSAAVVGRRPLLPPAK